MQQCWSWERVVVWALQQCRCVVFCYLGEGSPTDWPHTVQLGEPNGWEPEALPHQLAHATSQMPGGAQHPGRKNIGGVLLGAVTCAAPTGV
jgi:hypothetical protein